MTGSPGEGSSKDDMIDVAGEEGRGVGFQCTHLRWATWLLMQVG